MGKKLSPKAAQSLGCRSDFERWLAVSSLSKQEDASGCSRKLQEAFSEVKMSKDYTCFVRKVLDSELI